MTNNISKFMEIMRSHPIPFRVVWRYVVAGKGFSKGGYYITKNCNDEEFWEMREFTDELSAIPLLEEERLEHNLDIAKTQSISAEAQIETKHIYVDFTIDPYHKGDRHE